jgi:hypothetical protein
MSKVEELRKEMISEILQRLEGKGVLKPLQDDWSVLDEEGEIWRIESIEGKSEESEFGNIELSWDNLENSTDLMAVSTDDLDTIILPMLDELGV